MKIPSTLDAVAFQEFMNRPRTCSSCRQTFKVADFPQTTMRGVRVVRKWCKGCLKAYYRRGPMPAVGGGNDGT